MGKVGRGPVWAKFRCGKKEVKGASKKQGLS